MTQISCILASSKPWYRQLADVELDSLPSGASFFWVETPAQLTEMLKAEGGRIRYIFFLHWHWLVPESIWKHYECVCFHMSDLPYGRGGSPLQNLIDRGHRETVLTALKMNGELDAGPVYRKLPLSLDGRAEDIFINAARSSFQLVRWMLEHQPVPKPQEGEPVYFNRRSPEQSELPRTGTLASLYDHIRMLDAPTYPPGFIEYGDFVLEFRRAELQDDGVLATVHIRRKSVAAEEVDS